MTDLLDLNRAIVKFATGGITCDQEHYLESVSVCIGRLNFSIADINSIITTEQEGIANLSVVSINQQYLEHARLVSKDVLSGETARMVEMGFDWDAVNFFSRLSNRQIRSISLRALRTVFAANLRVLQGVNMRESARSTYAVAAGTNVVFHINKNDRCVESAATCHAIPADATLDDVEWRGQIEKMAADMVRSGAHSKIVERYTGLSHKAVSTLYRVVRGHPPKPGGAAQGSPEFFATANGSNHKSGFAWNLHSSIFLHCFDHFSRSAPYKVNRGWALLHAYTSYLERTEALHQETGQDRLTFNHAWSLLAFACTEAPYEMLSDLVRKTCSSCGVTYLLVTKRELDSQKCPMCEMIHSNNAAGTTRRRQLEVA